MQTTTERQRVSRRTPDRAETTPDGAVGVLEYRAPETLDKVGATASLLCAIHCALMPLVITLLPLVGLSFLADNRVEWGLITLSAVLGISSLCLGYREHRSRRALGVLGAGLGLLALGRIMEQYSTTPWGVAVVVVGGVTIAGAHLLNRLLCQSCRRCHTHNH